jgi:hypothetical protein
MLIKGIVRKNLTLRINNIPENIDMDFKYTFLAKIVELVLPTVPKLIFLSKKFDILDIGLLLGQHFIIPNHGLQRNKKYLNSFKWNRQFSCSLSSNIVSSNPVKICFSSTMIPWPSASFLAKRLRVVNRASL